MACIVAPDFEATGDIFVAEDLRHTLVGVPALVVNAGSEEVLIAPVALEVCGVAHVLQVVHGDVEVAIVVVVAGEEAGGVERTAHGEHCGEDFGMAEGDVQRVIAAEAAAKGGELAALILLAKEGEHLVHKVLLVLHVAGDAPPWRDGAVVPALGVDGVDADEL